MPEVLEIQIQDKTPTSAGGPPRAPGSPSVSGGSSGTAGAPKPPSAAPSASSKGGGGGDFPLEEYSETIERLHTGVDKVADQITSAFDKIKTRLSGSKEAPKPPQTPQVGGKETPQAPSASRGTPQATETPATPEVPQAPQAPSAAASTGEGAAGAAEGVSAAEGAAGAAEGVGGAEAVGGLIEGLGALDAATAGLATPFVVLAAVVGVGAVAAIEAFKFGMHVATDRVELFGLKLSSAIDELAKFSPAVAQSQAMGSVQSMLDDLREANETGDDLSRIVDAQTSMQHELRELFLPIKKVVTEIMADVMEVLAEWLKDARVLFSAEFWEVLITNCVKAAKPEWLGGITVEDAARAVGREIHKLREDMNKDKDMPKHLFLDQLFGGGPDADLIRRALDRAAGGGDARPNFPILDPLPGL